MSAGSDVSCLTDAELRAEMREWLRGHRDCRWEWINYRDRVVKNVAFDGEAASADGESERVALEAMVTAYRRRHARRSEAARRAAVTTQRRKEREAYRIAAAITRGEGPTRSTRCRICRRALDDEESIARGIGGECWQSVLSLVERARPARVGADA